MNTEPIDDADEEPATTPDDGGVVLADKGPDADKIRISDAELGKLGGGYPREGGR